MGEHDLLAKFTEANVHNLDEVKAVIFEITEDVSVIHNNQDIILELDMLNDVNTENFHA